ncbi:MAG: hypothetical protein IKB87_03275 [Clostridia bacterium]|nr:hypothetical protein [Clostridia bacterium]
MSAPVKMRVMCASNKGKIKTYAVALSEAFKCRVDDVPPAYSCDKERLVVIVASLKGAPSDTLRRFCGELNPSRAHNVALVIDNESQTQGVEVLKETLRAAGTNVIDDVYYVKAGLFSGSKITLEERTAIVKWVESIEVK